jgi:hypothetical protein
MAMRYQPQGLLRIDQGHPLAVGLRLAMLPGVNRAFDVAGMRSATPTGMKQLAMPGAMAAAFGAAIGAGSTDKIVTGLSGAFSTVTGRSYFFRARRNGGGGGGLGRLFDKTNGATGQFLMWYTADNRINYGFYLNGGATEVNIPVPNSAAAAAIGSVFDILVTHAFVGNTHIVSIYINGVLAVTDASRTTALVDAVGTPLTIGNRASDNARGWDGQIECAYVWDRVLSQDEATQLSANRYQLFVDPSEAEDFVPVAVGGYKLTADPGVFALSASSVILRASRAMQASAGVFSTSGASARLVAGRRMQVLSGAFGLSGAGAAVLASRRLPGALGALSLAGGLVGLVVGRRLPTGPGTFGLGGADLALLATRQLATAPGAFGLFGANAGLRATRRLAASTGMYALGPNSVQMVYQPVADPGGGLPKYTLAATPGSFGIVGVGALLRAQRQLQAAAGAALLSGSDARLAAGRRLPAESGGLSISGAPVAVMAARRIPAQAGTFDLLGLPVQLRHSAQIEYARAPAGSGYAPQRNEYQSRPATTSSPRPAATQRNLR